MPTPKFPISHVLVDCENVGLNGLTDLVVNTDGSPLKFVLFHNSTNKIKLSLTQLKDFGCALSGVFVIFLLIWPYVSGRLAE